MRYGGVKEKIRSTKESITLDNIVFTSAKHIHQMGWFDDLLWTPKRECSIYLPKDLKELTGFEPDGGVFCLKENDYPSLVIEAKKGDKGGQADTDLSYKNIDSFLLPKGINPNGRYIIFAQGEGCQSNQYAKTKSDKGKWLRFKQVMEYHHGEKVGIYLNPSEWTQDQVIKIIFDELCKITGQRPDVKLSSPPIKNVNDKFGVGKLDV